MAEIPLCNREGVVVAVALVDDVDYERLYRYSWNFHLSREGYGYARRRNIRMHREIVAAPPGLVVDHINESTLDNRRQNLRLVGVAATDDHVTTDVSNDNCALTLRPRVEPASPQWFAQRRRPP